MTSTRAALAIPATTLALLALGCPHASADTLPALPTLPDLGTVALPNALPTPLPSPLPSVLPLRSPTTAPTVPSTGPSTGPSTAPVPAAPKPVAAPAGGKAQAAVHPVVVAGAPRTSTVTATRGGSGTAALSARSMVQPPLAALPGTAMAPAVLAPGQAAPVRVVPALPAAPAVTTAAHGTGDDSPVPAVIAGVLIAAAAAGNVLSRRTR